MSRKRVEFNLVELEKLAAMQATDEEIASWFGASVKTVQRRKQSCAQFRKALDRGCAKGKISLRRNLFELSKTNPAVAMFLARNELGYQNAPAAESDPDIDIAERLREGRKRALAARRKAPKALPKFDPDRDDE
jgi:hypothetical protein